MKKFLRNIGLFLLPIVLVAIGLEIVAESIPNSYSYKRTYMEQHSEDIRTLILGSSNAYDGLNPSVLPHAFNLANSSQTLEDDYRLLERYIGSMDSLQTVIVGLSYSIWADASEVHRRTYYTIYMDLYPRWPLNKYSFEVFNLELLTKKIIKYAISRDVTRCDSLGQRLGHSRADAEQHTELWNKNLEELVQNDSFEWYKNRKNTADTAINKKNSVIKNAHSTSTMPNGTRGQERNHPQTPTSELAASIDANTPNMLSDNSTLNAYENTTLSHKKHEKQVIVESRERRVERNIEYLDAIIRLCEEHGVKVVIVNMPVMREYKDALPSEQITLHDSVMRNLPSSAIYIDASEWGIPADGWYNATHLTKEASVEFTKQLMDSMALEKQKQK